MTAGRVAADSVPTLGTARWTRVARMGLWLLLPCARLSAQGGPPGMDASLWEPLTFSGIAAHSRYTLEPAPGGGVALRCESHASASALALKAPYDPWAHPRLRFRWMADVLIPSAEPGTKRGDDYALRVYVIFPRKPGLAAWLGRTLVGQDLPDSSLVYVWANQDLPRRAYPNPFTARVRMLPLRGPKDLGHWEDEDVDVVADYRQAFGHDPPRGPAKLAVMCDSDNSGASASGWIAGLGVDAR